MEISVKKEEAIEKRDLLRRFERFEVPLDELVLDPTCFMKKQYLQGAIGVAHSKRITRLWTPEYLLKKINIVDVLNVWKPEGSMEWLPWVLSNEFAEDLNTLFASNKLVVFRTPEAATPFRMLLRKIEKENRIAAQVCAEILSFSFQSERAIFSPELGLTDILKRSGKAMIRIIDYAVDRKQEFLSSIIDREFLEKTRGIRWVLGGFLSLASLIAGLQEPIGIALWILDP